jgi:CheY-like chemotaxis protein
MNRILLVEDNTAMRNLLVHELHHAD